MERLLNRVRQSVVFVRDFVRHLFLHRRKVLASFALFLFIATTLYALFIHYPANFPAKHTFTIEEGTTVSEVAGALKREGFIRSSFVFKVLAILSQSRSGIFAGDYYFDSGENVFAVVKRTTTGDFGLTPISVFIPEGSTIFDIGEILGARFDKISGERFIELALKEEAEGYLFPDTYQFLPNVNEKKVYKAMRENFDTKIESIEDRIASSTVSLEDIIIMASLIEKESADDFEERRTISGILWNRIDIGMALQVDAVFPYINGKNTYELTTEDLQVDSPYNTYTNPGLPPGPIANPGLESIIAAIDPLPTGYLFYLHDLNGNVHYSVDFEGHRQNKFRYLR